MVKQNDKSTARNPLGQFVEGAQSIGKVFQKGFDPWNKGSKGEMVAWNKGKTFSEESKRRMRDAWDGKRIDLTGKVFGKLKVICSGESIKGHSAWRCICECGNEKTVTGSNLRKGMTQSCGCRQGAFGSKNPDWKGGITPENEKARKGRQGVAWRKAVFHRDSYTCTHCGAHGGTLNAHHIKPFASHRELRYDVDNGITLCVGCHREVHRKTADGSVQQVV